MKPLTESQNLVLNFIKNFRRENGTSPSYREIQRHFKYKSVKAVQDHVQALIQKGAIERDSSKRLARQILPRGEKGEGGRSIPVYGEIAAGDPRDTPQVELGTLLVSNSIHQECFGLKVVGNSMIDSGILEGDFVIVERCERARNGEIIVALLDGETTVKRYQEKNGRITLVPENSQMRPIAVEGKRLEIQGRVIGLQRRY